MKTVTIAIIVLLVAAPGARGARGASGASGATGASGASGASGAAAAAAAVTRVTAARTAPDAPLAPEQASFLYAIQGARIVPVSGPVIENGSIVFRDGVIVAVGANVPTPPGAQVIAGKGLTVYPGLIDMGSTVGLDLPPVARAE